MSDGQPCGTGFVWSSPEEKQRFVESVKQADKDVTAQVDLGDIDGESLPLTQCVCGVKFDLWDAWLSIYRDNAWQCWRCGRRLYFSCQITVYEIAQGQAAT